MREPRRDGKMPRGRGPVDFAENHSRMKEFCMCVASIRIIRPEWKMSVMFALLACLLSAWCGSAFAAAGSAAEPRVSFLWAFGSVVQENGGLKLRPVREHSVLKAGDKLKMMIELKKTCFVYVVYRNTRGEISLLFPNAQEHGPAATAVARKYFIPRQDAWFELDDHAGTETFYLIASDRQLTQLEYLIEQYRSADPGRKAGLAEQAIAEIEGIEADRRELASFAERSVGPAQVRGFERAQGRDPSDISVFAQEITSPLETCLRTFTIDHR